ncbi:transcriptional adapter 2-alpha isoform X1 [Agrilus planipennis]|uniref:Transcriptional adapter 2-alpha isoform X1 n=1 Tax=Agrilus planipennis TaxID=224129 RepID=A0A1W4WR03_AGRPL|nr:transcriptional adapter 2-alpha isoform X1 [Agrilus planipennis]
MSHINTDLTEEDAADLQFPKDKQLSNKPESTFPSTLCGACSEVLEVPYIVCVPCNVSVCKLCFVNGAEFSSHKNYHSYRVFNHNFILFENSNWTAQEELTLLDSLLEVGNWDLVAKQLPNKSVEEIKEHYNKFYLERQGSCMLPTLPQHEAIDNRPLIPYKFRLNDVSEPPRNSPFSISFYSLAGYNAARSEFELDYDSNAEDLIVNLKLETDSPINTVMQELQCAIIRSYNRRLGERMKRRRIIRDHGLILVRKTVASLLRYESTITRPVYERICRFMQFYKGIQFDYLMEGLHRAGELKAQISKLCEFRRKGIISLNGAHLYMNLKQDRDEAIKDVKEFQNNVQLKWKLLNTATSQAITIPCKRRGSYTPLDIVGLPGYEKLLPKEQELCSKIRLVPLTYLELKNILIAENNKFGFLKLQCARRLLKIDVNKTRKLYDFLIEEGYINKPVH